MDANIGLDSSAKNKIGLEMMKILSDTFILYLKTHNFHWNIKGKNFVGLHSLFEKQYTELWEALDTIAERVRALGLPVPATCADFARLSTIKETYGFPPENTMIASLLEGNEFLSKSCKELFLVADKANDQGSANLLADRMEAHEKAAWMLRSLLE